VSVELNIHIEVKKEYPPNNVFNLQAADNIMLCYELSSSYTSKKITFWLVRKIKHLVNIVLMLPSYRQH